MPIRIQPCVDHMSPYGVSVDFSDLRSLNGDAVASVVLAFLDCAYRGLIQYNRQNEMVDGWFCCPVKEAHVILSMTKTRYSRAIQKLGESGYIQIGYKKDHVMWIKINKDVLSRRRSHQPHWWEILDPSDK